MTPPATLRVLPALAMLILTACSAGAPASPSPTASATLTPAASASPSPAASASPSAGPTGTPYHVNTPESLRGNWQAMIQGTVVSSGLWTLEITNNEILATNPGPGAEPFAIGVTDITADHVTFWDDPECPDGGQKTEGTYTYAVESDQLTFTVIDDSCGDRRVLLTATTWERQP